MPALAEVDPTAGAAKRAADRQRDCIWWM